MKIKVFQSDTESFLEMEVVGQYKYIGESKADITNGKIYTRVKKKDGDANEFRIIDDSDEDFIYSEKDFELVEKEKRLCQKET